MNERTNNEASSAVAAFATKKVDFRFRSRQLRLALSHALFSSADVDTGTRFLLRVLSRLWDEDIAAGKSLPKTVLDAGSGVGVIGIAAAAALAAEGVRGLRIRSQDRDELAAEFTEENARENGIGPEVLAAYAEPLLAGAEGAYWDLILSNVPAKAGAPVLADFFARSAALLTAEGRAMVVIVNPLADAARVWIAEAGAKILAEESSTEHTVFVYGRPEALAVPPLLPAAAVDHLAPAAGGPALPSPAYVRTAGDFLMEETPYRIEAIHGVADFDEPGRSVVLAAKLLVKLGSSATESHTEDRGPSVLVHECDQGHFPAWLAARAASSSLAPRFTLVARNVLALAAACKNTLAACRVPGLTAPRAVAAVDLGIAADRLLAGNGPFDLIVSFPEAVPRVDRVEATWVAASKLLSAEGLFIVSQASTEAERFDRAKPRGFSRAGELKRDGFRAIAYRKTAT